MKIIYCFLLLAASCHPAEQITNTPHPQTCVTLLIRDSGANISTAMHIIAKAGPLSIEVLPNMDVFHRISGIKAQYNELTTEKIEMIRRSFGQCCGIVDMIVE
jgi:hypothetical protein